MNTSAIIMLIVVLVIFLGGIGFCVSRLNNKSGELDQSEDVIGD